MEIDKEEQPKFIWAVRRKRVEDFIMPKFNLAAYVVTNHWQEIILLLILLKVLHLVYRFLQKMWTRW